MRNWLWIDTGVVNKQAASSRDMVAGILVELNVFTLSHTHPAVLSPFYVLGTRR